MSSAATSRPFFSILMPTFNRAGLLPHAIESVLRQTYQDFELVISNGGSTDETHDIVNSYDDPRIRYIESDRRLDIGENYQQAFENARGDFIGFLSDDDAFVGQMLARVAEIISSTDAKAVVFRSCCYFSSASKYDMETIPGNSVVVRHFTGKLRRYEPDEAAQALFANFSLAPALDWEFNVSYLANAIVEKRIYDRIALVRSRMFDTTPADGYLAAAVAFEANGYFCLDEPLHVWRDWAENATTSPDKAANGLHEHYRRLLNGRTLDYVPLKHTLPLNCLYNAILMARSDFDTSNSLSIDWTNYYVEIHNDLRMLERGGVDVREDFRELNVRIAQESDEVQFDFRTRTRGLKRRVKSLIKWNFPSLLNRLRLVTGREKYAFQVYHGSDRGFNNILECSDFVSTQISNNY